MAVAKGTPSSGPQKSADGQKKGASSSSDGFSAWLNKGNHKMLFFGGLGVLAFALYERSRTKTAASSPATGTAGPVVTTTSSPPPSTVNLAGIEEQIAALGQQMNTIQKERSSPQSQIGSLFYQAEQDELTGHRSKADLAIHDAWEQAGQPHGLPIFQEPYPEHHSSGSGSQGGGSPSIGGGGGAGAGTAGAGGRPAHRGAGISESGGTPGGGHISQNPTPAKKATRRRSSPVKKKRAPKKHAPAKDHHVAVAAPAIHRITRPAVPHEVTRHRAAKRPVHKVARHREAKRPEARRAIPRRVRYQVMARRLTP